MTPETIITVAITPALSLLPAKMDSLRARAMLITIASQESGMKHRRQIGGPARSYWGFERNGGVLGVLLHPASKPHAIALCKELNISADAGTVYLAIEFNDVLACGFARLLLWTLPSALPGRDQTVTAYDQYIAAWRPGKARPETWDAFYRQAWDTIEPDPTTRV